MKERKVIIGREEKRIFVIFLSPLQENRLPGYLNSAPVLPKQLPSMKPNIPATCPQQPWGRTLGSCCFRGFPPPEGCELRDTNPAWWEKAFTKADYPPEAFKKRKVRGKCLTAGTQCVFLAWSEGISDCCAHSMISHLQDCISGAGEQFKGKLPFIMQDFGVEHRKGPVSGQKMFFSSP